MIPREHQQEMLSYAYVRAVAAIAGVICSDYDRDYGLDLSLRDIRENSFGFMDSGSQIDLQLKSTTRAHVNDATIAYDLNVRNYNHLRAVDLNFPRFLVVFLMPEKGEDWLTQSPEQLVLRHCAYWTTLAGFPESRSISTVRVALPRANVFSADAIVGMMTASGKGKKQ